LVNELSPQVLRHIGVGVTSRVVRKERKLSRERIMGWAAESDVDESISSPFAFFNQPQGELSFEASSSSLAGAFFEGSLNRGQ
jgi:hypothetical protein